MKNKKNKPKVFCEKSWLFRMKIVSLRPENPQTRTSCLNITRL